MGGGAQAAAFLREYTFYGLVTGGAAVRADYVWADNLGHVLAALTPANRLACEVSLATGLRIGDVLELTREQVVKGRFSVREGKTGKVRRVRLPTDLQTRILSQAGHIYAFPARSDGRKHRTRQAVYKDLRRAAKAFRLLEHVSPHSLRKCYAVNQYHRSGDIKRVQGLLNHSDESVTMIYALADALTARRLGVPVDRVSGAGAEPQI